MEKPIVYTDYCTCFYEPATGKVYFYDEITDCFLKEKSVKDKTEADTLMKNWVTNAPENIICQQIS